MRILVLGLSVTSSWGNGHATTYRSLCKALAGRGHTITFVEKNVEWYASNRDMPEPEFCEVWLYEDWTLVRSRVLEAARRVDVIVVGSFFGDGVAAVDELHAAGLAAPLLFYDIDTPITVAALREHGRTEYLRADQIGLFRTYLSFTGGPLLDVIQRELGAARAVPLFCSVDPDEHRRTRVEAGFAALLSYLGTYSEDRQGKLMHLLDTPAKKRPDDRFLVAGPMYPSDIGWADNVARIIHVSPQFHAAFYSSCRWTLNLTRRSMIEVGYSPSVRLFEAAACEAAIISDRWPGIETFFAPGEEIVLVDSTEDMLEILRTQSAEDARAIGRRARERVLAAHTAEHRATEFVEIVAEAHDRG